MRAAVLVRNEAIKTCRRPAVWMAFGAFVCMLLFTVFSRYFDPGRVHLASSKLPLAWPTIVSEAGQASMIFAVPMLVLLVTGEFAWRTARQNVIDGLSKDQFFLAKLLLVPVLAVAFYGSTLLIGGTLALAGNAGAAAGPLFRPTDVALIGGTALAYFGYLSLAFFLALTMRSAGGALACMAGLFAAEAMLRSKLTGDYGLALAPNLLPFGVFHSLADPVQHYPDLHAWMVAQSVRMGREAAPLADTRLLVTMAAIYIELFLTGAFVIFRKRDL